MCWTAIAEARAVYPPSSIRLPVPIERHYQAYAARVSVSPPVTALLLHDLTAIRRSEQMRADFVANASHELRTPLAAVSGFIDTLRGHARDDEVARDQFLDIMGVEAARMRRLIDDLLSLTRIEMNEHVRPKAASGWKAWCARLRRRWSRWPRRTASPSRCQAPDLPQVSATMTNWCSCSRT